MGEVNNERKNKTIVLFGGSGAIGKLFIEIASQNGYDIICYTRKKGSINTERNGITEIVGELDNKELIESIIKDASIVVSTLGPSLKTPRKEVRTPIADGHAVIIKAMEDNNINRFITIATPTISSDEDKRTFAIKIAPFMAKHFLPNGYREMKKIETLIKKSKVEWTVVRFLNPNVKGMSKGYKYSFGDNKFKLSVSRENIAKFIFNCISRSEFIRKMPIVYNK